ncbi:MAG TPA: hypothetical protein DCF73_10340 [Rhodobiaceae bacterium]|nr:hypothetical protein [Rhodobiaceae bacterium]
MGDVVENPFLVALFLIEIFEKRLAIARVVLRTMGERMGKKGASVANVMIGLGEIGNVEIAADAVLRGFKYDGN